MFGWNIGRLGSGFLLADTQRDRLLGAQLGRLRDGHEDHWAYGERSPNQGALFQYPAMMVADMQRDLTDALLADHPSSCGPVFDPFVGSGTVLMAAMALGRDFVGWDINPLAILICRVKAGPFHLRAFADAAARVNAPGAPPRPQQRFDNQQHWFVEHVAAGLTLLRGRIGGERNASTRRFLWVCLAETVRRTSNSRTSTVKLHRRPPEQIENRPDARFTFGRVVEDNLNRLEEARDELEAVGVLSRGWYRGEISLELGDTRQLAWRAPASPALVTSPPYGDNTSTVPYGQHAYLPLQWIDLDDVGPHADQGCLDSTYEIDRRSLGGVKRVVPEQDEELQTKSKELQRLLAKLVHAKRDRRTRVLAFVRDFDEALANCLPAVAPGAAAAWTVGSRRVGGQQVRLDKFLIELSARHGFTHVQTVRRDIPAHRKRMAPRNGLGSTIGREHVVILRRQS